MMNLFQKSTTSSSIVLILLLISVIIVPSSIAWDNCPFGEVNEPYPGTCGRYRDTDQDNICDLSQSPPETRMISSEENSEENPDTINETNTSIASTARINYYFIPILFILIICYLFTFLSGEKKIIKKVQHRKIWNFILLITFLVSGIFGLILAITISSGIRLSFYATLLFWHVEFGIAMAIISIFHIAWHWNYYKKMLIRKK
jgi:hypothetical protein